MHCPWWTSFKVLQYDPIIANLKLYSNHGYTEDGDENILTSHVDLLGIHMLFVVV